MPTVEVSTVPVVTAVMAPDASVIVAPAAVYVSPNSVVAGFVPVTVITGAVVSTTFTVLVAVAVLLSLSVAVYVIVYEPTALVLTEPDVVTEVTP